MTRLTRYLSRLFVVDSLALFAVASLLLFLMQCLRSFDVVSAQGQDLLTLVGQAILTIPTLAIAFLHVCIGIGLARALRGLQQSQELHIIHSSRQTGSLFRAIAIYAVGGMLLVLLLTNLLEPTTRKTFNTWSTNIAADLVGRTLVPHTFVQVTPGVTLVIGARGPNGTLDSFFADDARDPEIRRTYIADSATVAADDEGYVLQLVNGSIQYSTSEGQFSEVSFGRYDLAVDRLTASGGVEGLENINSIQLIQTRGFDAGTMGQLRGRLGEAWRVLSICLFVAAFGAFPHGRRAGREFPLEVAVLAVAFIERGISTNLVSPIPLVPYSGVLVVGAVSLAIL
ncbi:MAG TPA: LptF/LptG family permease, partial [Devosia sp.]|nr:LptF/LptG family permease [Devosia sp.]